MYIRIWDPRKRWPVVAYMPSSAKKRVVVWDWKASRMEKQMLGLSLSEVCLIRCFVHLKLTLKTKVNVR